jgi:hypothetical protein
MYRFPSSPFPVDGMLGGFPIRMLDMIVSNYFRNRLRGWKQALYHTLFYSVTGSFIEATKGKAREDFATEGVERGS